MKKLLIGLLVMAALLSACAGAEIIVWDRNVSADTSAEHIDFGNTVIEDLELLESFLDQFPSLKKCDLFGNYMTHAWAEALSARYPGVEFGWTFRIMCTNKDPHIIRTDMTAFSTLHNNRTAEHTDEELSVLRFCTELRALDIGHNAATKVDFLYEMPELRVLIIALNQVKDLTPVASLKHLEYLEMFRNRVRDLKPLSGLSALKDLNIGYNRVTDVTPLYPLTGLERLWLNRAGFYERGVPSDLPQEKLLESQKALSDTLIDSASSPTAGGWRKHPRYAVIERMFRLGEYIPFSD